MLKNTVLAVAATAAALLSTGALAHDDHGRGWVMYAVQSGEMEMSSYGLVNDRLVRRATYRIRAGECQVYLPGDIHDTRCVSDSVLMLRLTSCDLKQEEKLGYMTRYAAP